MCKLLWLRDQRKFINSFNKITKYSTSTSYDELCIIVNEYWLSESVRCVDISTCCNVIRNDEREEFKDKRGHLETIRERACSFRENEMNKNLSTYKPVKDEGEDGK